MTDFNTVKRTTEAIDLALLAGESLEVTDFESYGEGVTAGARMSIDAQTTKLTFLELKDKLDEVIEGWRRKPDFVLGALAGSLSVTTEFNNIMLARGDEK